MDEFDPAPLLYWIRERERIRELKESGAPPPWTEDEILRTYRFCNVHRKDDRVSRWLRANVLTPERLSEVGYDSFVGFTALCRWINWPPTIQYLMDCGIWPAPRLRWKAIVAEMERLKDGKGVPIWGPNPGKRKVWTGAYMITARGARPGQSKASFIIQDVIRKQLNARMRNRLREPFKVYSKQGAWEVLTSCNNWGSFMAGQVVDDWTWTPLLWQAKDNYSWAPQGPGSIRGLNRLLGLPLRTRHSQEDWLRHLCALRMVVIKELGVKFRSMTLHDLQNCLCELDKYLRAETGEGKPRSVYRTETAYE